MEQGSKDFWCGWMLIGVSMGSPCLDSVTLMPLQALDPLYSRETSGTPSTNPESPLMVTCIPPKKVESPLQILGQKYLDPTIASLIMSMESVVAVLCGCVFLKETMTGWEILGCVLVFIAVILSQIPVKEKNRTA